MSIISKFRNIKIGGKYGVILATAITTILIAVVIAGIAMNNSKQEMEQSIAKNNVALYSSALNTFYLEKYSILSEYLLNRDNNEQNTYLEYSIQFTNKAKELKHLLNDEQITIFNQIIENNEKLDEYFFITIVPNVQLLNLNDITVLQDEVTVIKDNTLSLGRELEALATSENSMALMAATDKLSTSMRVLIFGIIIAIIISFLLIFIISRLISNKLKLVVNRSKDIANGELGHEELIYEGKDEIGQLSNSINEMGSSLRNIISKILSVSKHVDNQSNVLVQTTEQVKSSSEQMMTTINEMAKGQSNQADNASSISQKMIEFNEEIIVASHQSSNLVSVSEEVVQSANVGDKLMNGSLNQMHMINTVVSDSAEKMNQLENKAQMITEIVNVINAIAKQTNILSLNATIEAAQAGEAGKAFAVVAKEVRALAGEVSKSVERISSIIFSVKDDITTIGQGLTKGNEMVKQGTLQIEQTGIQFTEIKNKVSDMANNVHQISNVMLNLQGASQHIDGSIQEIAAITEQSAAGSEEISASIVEQNHAIDNISISTKQLSDMVEDMSELIKSFKL